MWILLAVAVALLASIRSLAIKHGVRKSDDLVFTWALNGLSALFLAPFVFYAGIPAMPSSKFWMALGVTTPFTLYCTILIVRSLRLSDISLVVPLASLTPLFLLISSPLLLGEFPNLLGLIGVLFITMGSYCLNLKEIRNGWKEPFLALTRDPGCRAAMLASAIWGVTSNFDKIGAQEASPLLWSFGLLASCTLLLTLILLVQRTLTRDRLPSLSFSLVAASALAALSSVLQAYAVTLTLVAYVISIKRASSLISVLLGKWFYQEKNTQERLIGSVLMLIGVFFIVFA